MRDACPLCPLRTQPSQLRVAQGPTRPRRSRHRLGRVPPDTGTPGCRVSVPHMHAPLHPPASMPRERCFLRGGSLSAPPPTAVARPSARLTPVPNACGRHRSEATAHGAGAQVSHAWRQAADVQGVGRGPTSRVKGPQGRDAHGGAPAAPHRGCREHAGTGAGKGAPEGPPATSDAGGRPLGRQNHALAGRIRAPDSAGHDCAAQGRADGRCPRVGTLQRTDHTPGPALCWRARGQPRLQAPESKRASLSVTGRPGTATTPRRPGGPLLQRPRENDSSRPHQP